MPAPSFAASRGARTVSGSPGPVWRWSASGTRPWVTSATTLPKHCRFLTGRLQAELRRPRRSEFRSAILAEQGRMGLRRRRLGSSWSAANPRAGTRFWRPAGGPRDRSRVPINPSETACPALDVKVAWPRTGLAPGVGHIRVGELNSTPRCRDSMPPSDSSECTPRSDQPVSATFLAAGELRLWLNGRLVPGSDSVPSTNPCH